MLRIRRSPLAFAAAAVMAATLSACGGGGTSSLPATGGTSSNQPTSPTQPTGGAQSANATMVINIPAKATASGMRNPHYISASTKSITIGVVANGKTTQVAEADLTPTSPNCSVATGGATQCNVSFVGSAGANTFALTMYDAIGGKGNVLSTGNVSTTLSAGQNTKVALDLDGVPASLSVVLGSATLPVGTASSVSIFVQAKDAGGNIIIGPGGFANPIALAIGGDTYNTLALSTTTVTSPGQVVALAYTGGTNIGSTITASTTGASNATATFAGSGASVTYFGYTDPADGFNYVANYAVQPLPSTSAPTVAVLMQAQVCCWSYTGMIGVANPSGVQRVYSGDVTDPFNPPTAGALTYSGGITVVHGMSKSLVTWQGYEVSKELAVTPSGNVYYPGNITTSGDTTNCAGLSENTGTLGLLNPTSGSLVMQEKILKGFPEYMQLDSSGNLWFIEQSGQCNGSNLLPSGYAVGELTAGGTLTETDFGSTGLSGVTPDSMQLSNDGTSMYVGDNASGNLFKAALPALTTSSVAPTISAEPSAIAVAPDNTIAWAGNNDPGAFYSYGVLAGSKPFAAASIGEWQFPSAAFYSAAATYVDGSFWFASPSYQSGFARMTPSASGNPTITQYPLTFGDDDPELTGETASGGYLWAGDDEEGYIIAMQYGVQPTSGTITMATHRIGAALTQRNPHPHVFKRHSAR